MEKKSSIRSRQYDEPDLDLKEWALKARISRDNTNSRRFSASKLKSFREETTSFRSNLTISSTVSSPGYTLRDEIDPSTYSFTTALKALRAKTVYTWEIISPDGGFTLNSKWNDAEKYISNPLSGEVPLECLSANTLIGISSFRKITMSAPLIYPSHITEHREDKVKNTSQTEKNRGSTRDVGTQSTPVDLSSNSPSPSPTSTPSTEEVNVCSLLKCLMVN
ncbi:hypothetical protein BUALT_Bualt11G0053600 [Buddleja alternifolia]|uniref:Uncharacterized protein n=1 Tax=Buddleja alternifolia TaxID=168488 RepID=A0AAV6WXJ4_9LAMI|nr:hypothetical protein BUALT_Bualt11G0053600 [Buddleja alternifolia]